MMSFLQYLLLQICPISTHNWNVIHLHSPIESIYNLVIPSLNVPDLKVKLNKGSQPSSLPDIQIELVKQVPQPIQTFFPFLKKDVIG